MSSSQPQWEAPYARGPVNGRVTLPGSKSLTNREIILSALANDSSEIKGALWSRDTILMVEAIRQLGWQIEGEFPDPEAKANVNLKVSFPQHLTETIHRKDKQKLPDNPMMIDCGLSGTVMRFLPALAFAKYLRTHFVGDKQAYQRPQQPLISALRQLGALVTETENEGHLPFILEFPESPQLPQHTNQPTRPVINIDASQSSQFVSAFLLIGATLENGLEIHTKDPLPSLAHIEMTIEVLHQHGVKLETKHIDDYWSWMIDPGPISGKTVQIEPDLSNAGVFLAAAVVTGGSVTVNDWPSVTTQAGDAWREILPRLGAKVELTADGLTVTGPREGKEAIQAIDIDLSKYGELTPTLAAICALGNNPSRITGIGHLKGHETDRLKAITTEINKLGGEAVAGDDYIEFRTPITESGIVESYHDHRMATFGAILGLCQPGIRVENIETTSKTLPNFTQIWKSLEGLQ